MSEALVGRISAALAGRYRIERELGQGGMATVYVARDLRHDRSLGYSSGGREHNSIREHPEV